MQYSKTPLAQCRAEESQEVWKEGHAPVKVLLGSPVADKKSARTSDGGLTPFVTGYAAEPYKDAKDEKAASRFRGSFMPEIRNPGNHYISVPATQQPSKPKPTPPVTTPTPPAAVEQPSKPNPTPPVTTPTPPAAVKSTEKQAPKPKPRERARVTLLVSTFGDAYHAKQRRLQGILKGHRIEYEEVDGALTHLPDVIARRNELFQISGIRGSYPQLFIDDTLVGSYEECDSANENDDFKEMLQWRLDQPPHQSAGHILHDFYKAKGKDGGGVKVNMAQFDAAIGKFK